MTPPGDLGTALVGTYSAGRAARRRLAARNCRTCWPRPAAGVVLVGGPKFDFVRCQLVTLAALRAQPSWANGRGPGRRFQHRIFWAATTFSSSVAQEAVTVALLLKLYCKSSPRLVPAIAEGGEESEAAGGPLKPSAVFRPSFAAHAARLGLPAASARGTGSGSPRFAIRDTHHGVLQAGPARRAR